MTAAGFRKQLAAIGVAAELPLSCPSPHAPTCLRLRPRQRQARHPRHPGMARSPNIQHTTRSPTASSKWMSTASAYNLWKISVLRLAAKATRPVQNVGPEEAVEPPAPDAIGHAAHPDVAPTCRGPGRPRKHQAADAASSAPKRPRGRPKANQVPGADYRLRLRSTTNHGSCGVRQICSSRRRAQSMLRCRAPCPIGRAARLDHRRKSDVRSAMSRSASLRPRRRHNVSQVSSRTARNPLDRQLHADSHPDIDPASAQMPNL